jgi:phospholipid transport system transporter-binding protein
VIKREGDRLMLAGRLNISTVPAVYEAGLQELIEADLTVDWAGVEAVDSAAVSMLLGWARAAQSKQRTLKVANLPADLLSLADLYGVADMLPH